jgi:hypothetical protein
MLTSRLGPLIILFLVGLMSTADANAPKPEKVRVAFGSWTGRGAGSFKSGVRPIVAKGTVITNRKAARALVEAEVLPKDKGVLLRLAIKGAQSGELVESREFPSPRPSPSRALLNKIGRAIVDMVQRVPIDQTAPQP